MRSISWLGRFVRACATISLLAGSALASSPGLVVVGATDVSRWQGLARDAGWRLLMAEPAATPDARVQALATMVEKAIRDGVDPEHIYLAAGGGDAGTAALFYTISRLPYLWAAAVAIGGAPQPAIESGHLFAANLAAVPVLWATTAADDAAAVVRLRQLGLDLESRPAASLSDRAILDWLGQHRRDPFPVKIDCETETPVFSRCAWIQMTRFDAGERNDLLPSTRLQSGSGATLALGEFGYAPDFAGPGVMVTTLPDRYNGPLKVGDRIVELGGRPIADAQAYSAMLARYTEEQSVVAMVQRGKQRIRIETRVILPRRQSSATARVQAEFVPEEREIRIISRAVAEMRVTIPPAWAGGSSLFWNGLALEKIDGPGCLVLTVEKELLHAAACR